MSSFAAVPPPDTTSSEISNSEMNRKTPLLPPAPIIPIELTLSKTILLSMRERSLLIRANILLSSLLHFTCLSANLKTRVTMGLCQSEWERATTPLAHGGSREEEVKAAADEVRAVSTVRL